MFKIYDGREHFYQWDLDRQLIVEDPSVTQVHFCNRTDSCSLVCETYVEDGITLVNVPNILLQTDWKIHVYAYDGKHTKHAECYEVKSRTKPSDYAYTETEILNWSKIDSEVAAAIEEAERAVAVAIEETSQATTIAIGAAEQANAAAANAEATVESVNAVVGEVEAAAIKAEEVIENTTNAMNLTIAATDDAYIATSMANKAANSANSAAQSIDKAVNDAKAATTAANAATQAATEAADNTMEAVMDAMVAATDANRASDAANKAATNANEAADNANAAVSGINDKFANTLKGNGFGGIVAIDDISPIGKTINVNMSSKNLYHNAKDFTATFNGITATGVNDTSEIVLNGTATSAAGKALNTITLTPGTYTISLLGLNDTDKVNLQNADTTKVVVSGATVAAPKTFTLDTVANINIVTVIVAGASYTGQAIQIQIEKGLAATEYTPYFTEWDIAGVCAQGKNLFGGTFEIGGLAGANGNPYSNTKQIRSGFIEVGCADYILSTVDSNYGLSAMFFYDANKTMICMHNYNNITKDKVTSKAKYVRFRLKRADDADITEEDLVKVKTAFQFEVGTSATSYEPYVEPIHYEAWQLAEANGKIEGIYPSTTLIPEVNGVVMDVEYNRDLNKAFAELQQAIISLGGNV